MLTLGALWAVFLAPFVANHFRVRYQRHEERGRRSDSLSNWGLALQFLGIGASFALGGPPRRELAQVVLFIAMVATAFASWSLLHLGRHWRVQAVVTGDHELVRTGPYGIVRHPVYLSLMAMLGANALFLDSWPVTAASFVTYLVGTEVRIRSEERILASAFPREMAEYQARVSAYLPGIR